MNKENKESIDYAIEKVRFDTIQNGEGYEIYTIYFKKIDKIRSEKFYNRILISLNIFGDEQEQDILKSYDKLENGCYYTMIFDEEKFIRFKKVYLYDIVKHIIDYTDINNNYKFF